MKMKMIVVGVCAIFGDAEIIICINGKWHLFTKIDLLISTQWANKRKHKVTQCTFWNVHILTVRISLVLLLWLWLWLSQKFSKCTEHHTTRGRALSVEHRAQEWESSIERTNDNDEARLHQQTYTGMRNSESKTRHVISHVYGFLHRKYECEKQTKSNILGSH